MKKFLLLIALIISGLGFANAQDEGDNTIIDYGSYALEFTVTSLEPAECEVSVYEGSPMDIIIPSIVTFGETEFAVTSISDYTFNRCESLMYVNFEDDSQLTSIGYRAFYGCSNLRLIRCHAAEVPTTESGSPFPVFSIQNIQVPEASVEDYKAAN